MFKTSTLSLLTLVCFTTSATSQTKHFILHHNFNDVALTDSSSVELSNAIHALHGVEILHVRIQSHTDKTGSASYNYDLSNARSQSVLKLITDQLPGICCFDVQYFGADYLLVNTNEKNEANRRTEIEIVYKNKSLQPSVAAEVPTVELVPFFEDVAEQSYPFNVSDTAIINARGGTVISIPGNAFADKAGNLVTGNATLLIKEYYQPSDIMLAGMHSQSDKGLLQTGGMIKYFIVKDGDTLQAMADKKLSIRMPDDEDMDRSMNVFTAEHEADNNWKDAAVRFDWVQSRWEWPAREGKFESFYPLPIPAKWAVGNRYSDEYETPNIEWKRGEGLSYLDFQHHYTKKLSYTVLKKDSTTLVVELSEKFRNKGIRKFGVTDFDTSFEVHYKAAYYKAILPQASYINCDRFLEIPNRIEFHVKTPGFKGASVLVYFKTLKSFMPAQWKSGKYVVAKVPPNEKVFLVAFARNGDDYYFSKVPYTTYKNDKVEITLQKGDRAELEKMFASLNHKN